jgi:hypothetical protein
MLGRTRTPARGGGGLTSTHSNQRTVPGKHWRSGECDSDDWDCHHIHAGRAFRWGPWSREMDVSQYWSMDALHRACDLRGPDHVALLRTCRGALGSGTCFQAELRGRCIGFFRHRVAAPGRLSEVGARINLSIPGQGNR